ncbi:MAG: response regulator [Deltaproteobacteria bacterium]|nr:MAG: response regulator [Deltaproteobacteria bacterium]
MGGEAMKILIVDDFATMRKILKNILKELGYTDLLEAEDGQAALEILRREKVDLVISDWNMPNMDGLSLLKAIRSDEALKDTPVLMVTAEAQKQNVLEAVKAGVNNYVVKPFTPEVIQEKISKIFASR